MSLVVKQITLLLGSATEKRGGALVTSFSLYQGTDVWVDDKGGREGQIQTTATKGETKQRRESTLTKEQRITTDPGQAIRLNNNL